MKTTFWLRNFIMTMMLFALIPLAHAEGDKSQSMCAKWKSSHMLHDTSTGSVSKEEAPAEHAKDESDPGTCDCVICAPATCTFEQCCEPNSRANKCSEGYEPSCKYNGEVCTLPNCPCECVPVDKE